MCFVFALETPEQMFFNAPLLSQFIGGTTDSPVTPLWSCIRHRAFRMASEQATYSASGVEVVDVGLLTKYNRPSGNRAMSGCFEEPRFEI